MSISLKGPTVDYTKPVQLKDFILQDCPYRGCINNEDGMCTKEDIMFLFGRIDQIGSNVDFTDDDVSMRVLNDTFDCNFLVEEGKCPYCDGEIKTEKYAVPYGNDVAYKKETFCDGCGK